MIEIQVFGMVNVEEGATIAEDGNPDFYDILVRNTHEDEYAAFSPIEEIENLTWEEVQPIVEKLEQKYGETAEYVNCP